MQEHIDKVQHYSMEASNIQEVEQKVFGGTEAARGRLFVTSIWEERVMMVLDSREHPDAAFETYTNVLVPTICAECGGYGSSRRGAKSGFEISDKILRRSGAFLAMEEWCKGSVEVIRQVEDHETIMSTCRKHRVYFKMAEVKEVGMDVVVLQVKDYYDPEFA